MARSREFDIDTAIDDAIAVFRNHGFEGSSAQMLVDSMKIGRQSLYIAFGDKWQLYCSAVLRYGLEECAAHCAALGSGTRAIDGIKAMLDRVVETAGQPCLGVSAIWEFGTSRPDLTEITEVLAKGLRGALTTRIRDAQREADIAANLDPDEVAEFLVANIAGIRTSGRGGANRRVLAGLAEMALRALR